MELSAYRLLSSLGSGPDGVAYLAEAKGETDPVEVRILTGAAANPERLRSLARNLPLARMIDHPAALGIVALHLDREPPFIVVDRRPSPAADAWPFRVPLSLEEVVGVAFLLCDLLSAAHRLGLCVGRLSPGNLLGPSPWEMQIDCTGLECGTRPDIGLPASLAERSETTPSAEGDCRHLGLLLHYLFTGKTEAPDPGEASEKAETSDAEASFARLLRDMLAPAVEDRPALRAVNDRVAFLRRSLPCGTCEIPQMAPPPIGSITIAERVEVAERFQIAPSEMTLLDAAMAEVLPARHLGRFRLMEKVGSGNMGTVYRAEDVSDGTPAAVKVLRPDLVNQPSAVRRLYKEARLLAQVNNPYITNLLEVNEDLGVHYLVMEFVAGQDLGQLLRKKGPMRESAALSVLADVARALVVAHRRGIVHRDIKPENILLLKDQVDEESFWLSEGGTEKLGVRRPRIKLADFGLARFIDQSESMNITTDGIVVGTPLYISPEQASNRGVSARSDIYSMGATLFHLLVGRPPFVGTGIANMIAMHCNEPPPSLQSFNPDFSDALCQVVARMLEKVPEARYANAGELLTDLERLLRGEPTNMVVHPQPPACDPKQVLSYDWTWDLEASPEGLWPLVSDTERFNKAIGLPAVDYSAENQEAGGVRRFGQFRKLGIVAVWEEHPFEWVEGRRMGVLREYSKGVFKWMTSVVELAPRVGGGTRLTQRIRIEPTGLLGRLAAAIEVGLKCRRAADRVYRRIDAVLTGKLGNPDSIDAFEAPHRLARTRRLRLEGLLDQLDHCGLDLHVVARLGEFLAEAPAQQVARIRPLELARRLALDPDQTVDACLHGTRLGLLVLLWDILCPRCRVSCSIQDTIKAIRDHAHCTACNADFELDFSKSVEMVFRIHPQIRDAETGTYCVGGPAHSPHGVAQVRLAAGERFELVLSLREGNYRLRGPQLSYSIDFRVQSGSLVSRWEIDLEKGPDAHLERTLDVGTQFLVLNNPLSQGLVIRVERALAADVLTAARATALPLFRTLFPGEILSPGQLISAATLTMVATDLEDVEGLYRDLGDARAVAIIHEHFRTLEEFVRKQGGSMVKIVHNGMLVAFHDNSAAVRTAVDLQRCLSRNENTRNLRLRVAVHRGPTLAATLNNQLDYFGQTVNVVLRLAQQASKGEVVLTETVAADPQVASLMRVCRLAVTALDPSGPDSPPSSVDRAAIEEAATISSPQLNGSAVFLPRPAFAEKGLG